MRRLTFLFVCILLTVPCRAEIITVDDDDPADFNNIQAAINDSNDGDTIIVADGIYTGAGNRDIDFNGKAITVRSENGPETCIIDCQGTETEYHRGFIFQSGEDANSFLDGFTIANGWAFYGGGIFCGSANPIVNNCIFLANSVDTSGCGGGMYNENSSPSLNKCAFIENSADTGGGGYGGGMYNNNSSPTLVDCVFTDNSAEDDGGGICNEDNSSPTLTNCTFSGNSGDAGGAMINYNNSNPMVTKCTFIGNYADRGGALYDNNSNLTMSNCALSGNWAGWKGEAYNTWTYKQVIFHHSSPTLTGCTFSGNWADSHNRGALEINASNATVANCIFWTNSDSGETDESAQIDLCYGGTLVINYSCVQGWTGVLGGLGNHGEGPLFVDADGDDNIAGTEDDNLSLLSSSPCINAGDPNYIAEPNETDLDGKPRVIGGRIDMGAYEYSPPVPAEVRIIPRTINLTSKGKWISCYIWLPEDYNVADIEPNSVLLEDEIKAESLWINEEEQIALAKFNRSELQSILNPLMADQVELTITGQLTDGTFFEGTDTIRVIDKAGKK